MRKIAYLFIVALLAGGLGACGDDDGQGAEASTPSETATEQQGTTDVETTTGSDAKAPSCAAGSKMVSAQANIFGSGTDYAPFPGGGGGGVVSQSWRLPERSSVVTFPTITGKVTPIVGVSGDNGPGGKGDSETDINSYEGISGIVHRRNAMFLVGVFLTDDPPSKPAPKRLDFTKGEHFRTLAPGVGQTFFVGDGKGRTFRVPRGATRLFLGFADGYFYKGDPGYYANNSGHLCVEVNVAKQ